MLVLLALMIVVLLADRLITAAPPPRPPSIAVGVADPALLVRQSARRIRTISARRLQEIINAHKALMISPPCLRRNRPDLLRAHVDERQDGHVGPGDRCGGAARGAIRRSASSTTIISASSTSIDLLPDDAERDDRPARRALRARE